MPTTTEYKTINGHVVSLRTPTPASSGYLFLDGNFRSIATCLEEMAVRTNRNLSAGDTVPTASSPANAINGDWYICTSNGNWYELQQSGWVVLLEMKGDAGTPGTNGTDGVGYIAAAINAAGELVLTKSDNSTVNVGAVKGADGATGATGPAGETGAQGPAGATGAQGPAGADAEVSWTIDTDNDSTSCSFATVNGTMKIFGNSAITALTLTAGSGWAAGHCSAVRFLSPSTAATITAPSGWVFKGDACTGGVFTPEASKAYLLTILHDSVETLVTVLEVA